MTTTDARKRLAENTAAEVHHIHPDAGVRELIERERRAAAMEALRNVADAWTQGEWSNVMLPKPTPPAVPVIAYANRMGEWLRGRADRLANGATS